MRYSLEGLLSNCSPQRFVDQDARVQIRWLKSRPELNDQLGNVVKHCAQTGRFGVRINGETLFIKPANLLLDQEEDSDYGDDDPEPDLAANAAVNDEEEEFVRTPAWTPPVTTCAPAPVPIPLQSVPLQANEPRRAFDVGKFDRVVKEHEQEEKAEADERHQKEQIKFIDEKLNPLLAENEPSQKGMDSFLRKEYRKPRGEDGMIV